MKKTLLLIAVCMATLSSIFAQVVVSGDITANTTWTKTNTYLLSGFVYVKNGATLTIEAGTLIKGDKVSKGTLIVTRGSKIVAEGSADQPIVFTSNETSPTYGDWGGIIILGNGTTNTSYQGTAGCGEIEGGVNNAALDGLYGGACGGGTPNAADNSGILKYVRIEYPGIAFQPNNEINGLTLGAVGSGTTIDNVQISYAGDDSFEWFGGSVNAKHLIAYRGLDDDFDADFGYNGNIQFAYSQRDPAVADVSGSNGFEIDNNATGTGATPKTRPTFSNVTIVGPTGTVAPDYRRANHLRRNSEPGVFNSLFIGSYPVGLLIDGDSSIANAQAGRLVVKNSFYHGMATPLSSTNAAFDIAAYATANQISTGTNSADAQLVDPFNLNAPDPRPLATSPVLSASDYTNARLGGGFFTPVSYAGAFGPSGDWTASWSRFGDNLQQIGLAPAPDVVINSNITTNTTWTADKTYILQGFIFVKNCATLTIEPGTVIQGDKGTKGALIITRCSKIIADGTSTEPIVFTTNDPEPTYGSWGGIIILGNGTTNTSYQGTAGCGEIEGGVNNAALDGLYGGACGGGTPNAADNSGILRYVRIEYPGIAFQPNNEINGLTLGAVGSGTTIDNVQISYAGDDSFEWFGGSVNAKHLIAYRGLDDDFDADFGYNGNVQFAYSQRDPAVADVSGSNGFEIDNNATGTGATPKTRPTFSNVTIVGPTGTVAPDYRRANHLRRNSEPGVFNSLFIGSYPVGLLIDGDSAIVNAQTGRLVVKNSFYHGMATPLSSTNAAFDIAAYATANQISTGTNSADAQLVDPFNLNLPNPRPQGASPVLGASDYTNARLGGGFFTTVSYAGAFGPSGDWTASWSRFGDNLQQIGLAPSVVSEVIVNSNITSNTTWTADKTYVIQGFIYVKNCATLTIQPGTVIKGDKGTKGALIITRCSKIIADGTSTEPIVFTTNDPEPTYGSWGGIIILGNGTTNTSYQGTAGCGEIEGGVNNAALDGLYGGACAGGTPNAADNSGILRYVRIEYPGIAFQPNNEINGLTLGAVGSGTTIDNVQVSYSGDDSFEWFGGSVNAKHLIAYRGLDDDFDADFGFNGNVQYAFSVRDPQVADVSGSNGFEIDNNATGTGATPKTRPTFSNVTIVGPTGTVAADYRRAAHLRRNSEPGIFNSILMGSYPVGIFIDGDSSANNATANRLEVKNTFVAGPTALLTTTNTVGFNVTNWFNTAGWGNSALTTSAAMNLQDPFNLDLPNAQPTFNSPALNAASFTAARINNAFFNQVTYAGAFSGDEDWTQGWAKYLDLNVDGLTETENVAQYISRVKMFPTIANDQVTLQMELTTAADLNVSVYGLNGQFFGSQINEKAVAGEQQFTLNTSQLPIGFYLVRIQAGNAVKTEKLIVVR